MGSRENEIILWTRKDPLLYVDRRGRHCENWRERREKRVAVLASRFLQLGTHSMFRGEAGVGGVRTTATRGNFFPSLRPGLSCKPINAYSLSATISSWRFASLGASSSLSRRVTSNFPRVYRNCVFSIEAEEGSKGEIIEILKL